MRASVHPYCFPLAHPLRTATGSIDVRRGFIVALEDGEGHRGLGEAAPLPGWSAERLSDVQRELTAWARQPLGDGGSLCPATAHAVSCASRDLDAQRTGTPLARALAAEVQSEVPIAHLATDAADAAALVEGGARCLKFKVAVASPSEDLVRLLAVREVVGPDIRIRVDANRGWSLATARAMLPRLADLGITLIEEPVEQPQDMAHLRGHGVGIAADESVRNLADLTAIIAGGLADTVVIKPMLVGSLEACRSMITEAAAAGLQIMVTTSIDAMVARRAALHLAATVPSGHLVPCGLMTGRWLAEDLGSDLIPVAGCLRLPELPGLGLRDLHLPAAETQ